MSRSPGERPRSVSTIPASARCCVAWLTTCASACHDELHGFTLGAAEAERRVQFGLGQPGQVAAHLRFLRGPGRGQRGQVGQGIERRQRGGRDALLHPPPPDDLGRQCVGQRFPQAAVRHGLGGAQLGGRDGRGRLQHAAHGPVVVVVKQLHVGGFHMGRLLSMPVMRCVPTRR